MSAFLIAPEIVAVEIEQHPAKVKLRDAFVRDIDTLGRIMPERRADAMLDLCRYYSQAMVMGSERAKGMTQADFDHEVRSTYAELLAYARTSGSI